MERPVILGSVTFGLAAILMMASPVARAERFITPPSQLATGQYITPLAVRGAKQQFLNPGLPAYPNFIAGEAVRSRLSPDGRTLAVLTAGQNSLYAADGTVDTAAANRILWKGMMGAKRYPTAPAAKRVSISMRTPAPGEREVRP